MAAKDLREEYIDCVDVFFYRDASKLDTKPSMWRGGQVEVITATCRTITIETFAESTLLDIKEMIQIKYGMPVEYQLLHIPSGPHVPKVTLRNSTKLCDCLPVGSKFYLLRSSNPVGDDQTERGKVKNPN
jgi:hypothetical protein